MVTLAFGSALDPVLVSADPGIVDIVRSLFSEGRALAPAKDGGSDPEVSLTAIGHDEEWLLKDHTTGEDLTFPRASGLLSVLEERLVNLLLAKVGSLTQLHAAGAVFPPREGQRRGVIAVGPSGAGKSSLALAWARVGATLLGDDVVLVNAGGRVSPFPRLVKVDASRLGPVGLSRKDTLAPDPAFAEVWYEPLWDSAGTAGSFAIDVVASVCYDPEAGPEPVVNEVGWPAMLQVLLTSLMSTGLDPAASMDRLIHLTRGARLLDVRFSDSIHAARILAELALDPGQGYPPNTEEPQEWG